MTAVIQSVSNVTLLSSPHLYHISGLLVREVAPRESYLSSNQRDGLVEVVQLFSKYIASSLQQEKEKLVRQCVLLINSLIRSEQTVSGSAATETKEQNRQVIFPRSVWVFLRCHKLFSPKSTSFEMPMFSEQHLSWIAFFSI